MSSARFRREGGRASSLVEEMKNESSTNLDALESSLRTSLEERMTELPDLQEKAKKAKSRK